jgi:hypothetical protein
MSEAWKAHERAIAKALGGERLPNTGKRSPDVVAGPWAIEVKTRRSLPRWLLAAIAQAEEGARATGRLPLLVLTLAPGKGRKVRRYALLPLEALVIYGEQFVKRKESNLAGSEVIRDEGDAANR